MLAERPFPTKSSIQSQKNCMSKTSNVKKNTAINGPTNAFMISLSNFLNIFISAEKGEPIITFAQSTPLENDHAENKNTAFTFRD